MPPTPRPSSKPDLNRNDSLTSQLSSEKIQFKPQLISPYMVSTPYKCQLNPNLYNDHYILSASKQLAPYEFWTANLQKDFSLQRIFLRLSVFDLHTDDSITKFQSVDGKRVLHKTYKFCCDNLPANFTINFIFWNRIFISPFLIHLFYNLETACTIGSLRV